MPVRAHTRGQPVLLLAALAVALGIMPLPDAVAKNRSAAASASGRAGKQVRALRGQTAALFRQISALQAQLAALEGKASPAAVPPHGVARGDLSGSYPNPVIPTGSIGTDDLAEDSVSSVDVLDGSVRPPEISDGTVSSADIFDHQIGRLDLEPASVGWRELGETKVVQGPVQVVPRNQRAVSKAKCPPGMRLLSGGGRSGFEEVWGLGDFSTVLVASYPDAAEPGTWIAIVRNLSGVQTPPIRFYALALCLKA